MSVLPRAPGWPMIGSTPGLLRDPLGFLRSAHALCGPIFEVRAATRRFVVLAGREANRFVGREGRELLESDSFWGQLSRRRACPHAILAIDGEPHKTLRKLYGDALSRRVVDEHRDGCDALVRDSFGIGEQKVYLQAQTRLLIARLVHHCLAGGAAAIPEATARALLEVFRWETNTLLLGKWPKLALRLPRYRAALVIAERFIDTLAVAELEHAQLGGQLGGWFAKIREGRAKHPELFDEGDVRFSMLLPFVAGVDTVGATLGFVLDELHRHPALHARITAEVEAAYADGPPSVARLTESVALHGLVLECLRLYPAAFAMYRGAATQFEFAGCSIPAGTQVAVFTSATHFDARYFPEPERLDVERHATPRSESRQKHVFMPFGGGPHVCLGAGMGEALLLLASAAIIRHHRLRTPSSAPRWRPVFDPSLTIDPRAYLVRQHEKAPRSGGHASRRAQTASPPRERSDRPAAKRTKRG